MGPKDASLPTIIEWLDQYLEQKGAVDEVGPEYYTAFLELSDKELRRVIRLIIYGHAKEINRMVFDENNRYKDEDIYRLIQDSLLFLALGWFRFGPDGTLCLVKPNGPKPTSQIQLLIDRKIARCRPLIRRALVEIGNR